MNRLDRLTSILIQLQSKRLIKAQEIADRFEISLRTVYRDIRTLELAGVPIISEAGVGYSLLKEYRLPPVHFTLEEALSFLTAEKLILKQTNLATQKTFTSALFKIKATLNHHDKEKLDDAAKNIGIKKYSKAPESKEEDIQVPKVLMAISEKKKIKIQYANVSDFKPKTRIIEPVGIFAQGEHWYLVAFCEGKQDYRNFRMDRIIEVEFLQERFIAKHPNIQSFIDKKPDLKPLTEIIIQIDKSEYRYIGDQKFYMGFVSETETNSQVRMRFLSQNIEGFAVWFLWLGKSADIIQPESLKNMVRVQLEKIQLRLNNTGNGVYKK